MRARKQSWSHPAAKSDIQNTARLFRSDNDWGIPLVEGRRVDAWPYSGPQLLWAWDDRLTRFREAKIKELLIRPETAWHFFIDDERFEGLWRSPERNLAKLRKLGWVVTPDFSTYVNWPRALNLFQVYRNRWLGAYWESLGMKVIPSVSWSDEASFDYAFCGVARGAVVAIQTQTLNERDADEMLRFQQGLYQLRERITPTLVLCYGGREKIRGLDDMLQMRSYPTRWDLRRDLLRFFPGPGPDLDEQHK